MNASSDCVPTPRAVRCLAVALAILVAQTAHGGVVLPDTTRNDFFTPEACILRPGILEPPRTAEPPRIAEVDEAVEAFKRRDSDRALEMLERAARKYPDLLQPREVKPDRPFPTRATLETAVVNHPDDPENFVILGEVAIQERRVTEAGLLFGKAKELLPLLRSAQRTQALAPRILSGLAAIAEAREQWADAQSSLELLLTILPMEDEGKGARARAIVRLARAMFQQKKVVGALDKLREAHKLDPDNVLTPEAAISRFYQQYGDWENAIKWMNKAVSEHPEDLRTRLAAAQQALERANLKNARTHIAKALEIAPESPEARKLGEILDSFEKPRIEKPRVAPGRDPVLEEIDRGMMLQERERRLEMQRRLEMKQKL
jgi:tetratricopeptide (TPR) repeat protein